MLDRLPAVTKPRGRPRRKPVALVGDAGYGFPALIAAVASRRIIPLLAERGRTLHGSGLGWFRCVVERTLAWFGTFRRLKLCYERTDDHFQGFHDPAAAVLCARRLDRLLW
jgi:transposase